MDGPGAGRGAEAGMTHWRPCMLPRAHGALGARPGGLSPGSPTTSASAIRGSHGGPPWSMAVANTARPRAGGGVDGARAGHAGGRGELAEMPETQLRVDSPSRAVNQVTCDDSPGQGLARNCDHHNTGLR